MLHVCRRRVWVRQPVQLGLRDQQRGAEHGAVQRRRHVRRLLHHLLRHRQEQDVQAGHPDHRLRHQLLPAQLGAPQRQRRLVQPAAGALRHVAARLDQHRHLRGRHRPRRVQEGLLPEARRHPLRHLREGLLRAGGGDQRRRQRGRVPDVDQGLQHQLARHEPQLGRQLAEQRLPQRPEALLQGQARRRPRGHGQRRRAVQLVVRGHLHFLGELLLASRGSSNQSIDDTAS
uniref:Uncharacterized protein n=1 Tax=Aegilops tauschii subsp. strangulata TaxID=200361 RepID=A0A453MHV6_AEGTS